MNKPKLIKIVFILITIFIVTACNLPLNNTSKEAEDQEIGTDEAVIEVPALTDNASVEVDAHPVGLQEGLGSFDSYHITLFVKSSDSSGSKMEINETTDRSIIGDASHSITTTVSFDPENDTEESTSTMEIYTLGNVTCENSDDEWTYNEMTDQEKEMLNIFTGMVDFLPLINNPEFVGEENMNGIDTNHFTFKVAGIGDTSGSLATVNDGNYWLAKDGQYIVKYHLVLVVQSAAEGTPDAEISNIEALIDLTNVNAPVSITLPPDCQSTTE